MNVLAQPPHRILPQQAPFLMVDRVVAVGDGRIECLKNLAYNEPYFGGHFPGDPMLPGVLMIEACAQAALLLTASTAEEPAPGTAGLQGYLVDVRDFRVYRPARPGDALRIVAKHEERFGTYLTVKATIHLADTGRKVAAGRLTFFVGGLTLEAPPVTAESAPAAIAPV